MRGPYLLRPLQVDIIVPSGVGGVFCLAKNPRKVVFVGRAEQDLRDAIKAYWKQYEFFWFEPALSKRECYINHCYCYHNQMGNGGLDDDTHPAPPEKMDIKCPVCGK
ncbi:hypothetical protein CH330_06870 [candidate division WOR-3 bacterium JGI_Cruoil_03_51_56]|uniref:GIY-YIG domain-containing protein n=1 Tax=candidate division WOR-3 bacterium JGI_Cruoil_03_51_56 TaxID=1973747 RepID=A0A235BTW1_UNCW3|nr:MAG: hypothetical protein CH330_06870 [candidate division WOR-3 bacterium JGI_Cruoil_03_51_56]